jgi:hypothetical protein
MCAGEGIVAGFRTAAGCQPATQPINNRRHLAGAGSVDVEDFHFSSARATRLRIAFITAILFT